MELLFDLTFVVAIAAAASQLHHARRASIRTAPHRDALRCAQWRESTSRAAKLLATLLPPLKGANRHTEQRGELRLRQTCALSSLDDRRRNDTDSTGPHFPHGLQQLGGEISLSWQAQAATGIATRRGHGQVVVSRDLLTGLRSVNFSASRRPGESSPSTGSRSRRSPAARVSDRPYRRLLGRLPANACCSDHLTRRIGMQRIARVQPIRRNETSAAPCASSAARVPGSRPRRASARGMSLGSWSGSRTSRPTAHSADA